MIMKERPNHYHCSKQHPDKNRPVNVNPESKTQTGFGLPSAAVLLNWMMAYIGSAILLPTEQSVINT